MIKEEEEKEKIPRRLNEILIERIRKYETQDFSQLLNSPNDGDTNAFFLGGLINLDMGKNDNNENEDNYEYDLDKMTVNDIYIEPYKYNDYEELNEEEEEEEEEGISDKNKNKYNLKSDENNAENISVLLNQDYNQYLDLIQKNYKKFENNHFPKLITDDNNNKSVFIKNIRNKIYETKDGKKIIVNNDLYPYSLAYLKNKDLFYDMPRRYKLDDTEFTLDYNLLEENMETIFMKSREFIDMNSKISTSMSKVLLYSNYLDKYINDKLEPFNNSINISCEKIKRDKQFINEIKTKTMQNSGNIILKRLKMDNTKKLVAKLNKYKNLKNIMTSVESLFSDPKKSQEIYDLISKCKEEIEKIKIINNNEHNCESIIEIFEEKLREFKNRNDAHMSGELSQVLNNYFINFLSIDNEKDKKVNKNEKIEEYEKYGISKFVLEKVYSLSEIYESILNNLNFSSYNKELEIINRICDYYIDGHLMNNIYVQLRDIFTNLSEQRMEYILKIFREKLRNKKNPNIININKNEKENNIKEKVEEKEKEEEKEEEKEQNEQNDKDKNDDEVDSKKENENTETENTENEKENENEIINEKIENNEEIQSKENTTENNDNNNNENNDNNKNEQDNEEIFILLCILLSKNKLLETLFSFIDLILNKVENSEIIEKLLKKTIIKECKQIKNLIQENFNNVMKEQIKKCLNTIAINDNIDLYINNYYLVLEMIKNEIPNYESNDNKNKINNNTNNPGSNINNILIKVIIKAQKNFIEHWAKLNVIKFQTDRYKTWKILEKIPQKYQNFLNAYFSFDLENNCMKDETVITKFPSDKLNLIKEALEEEENNNENEENEKRDDLLDLKDGDKPELKIKINQTTALDLINFSFDILKMFSLFHKECYSNIIGNVSVIIISHLNYQTDLLYEGEHDFVPSQTEISMSYCIFVLIQYIYEHIRESEFFVEIAKNCKQKLIDNYLEINTNINSCLDMAKKRIEEILDKNCLKESLDKLKQIQLPNYYMVSGDVPVKEYAITFVSSLKDIYESMINSYDESFTIEMTNKALETFFDNFEDFIFHGRKIEEENCLKQFKRDMIFLKKNLALFITILDLSDVKNRIDNINKSVLPEWMLKTKKK